MMSRLVRSLDAAGVGGAVCTLSGIGPVGESLVEQGFTLHRVDMRNNPLSAVARLRSIIRADAADVVHTWLYHANLLGGLAARKIPGIPVVWSLRNSRLKLKASTSVVVKLCALLSRRVPRVIVACAESAKREHVRQGYPASLIQVIPNGFDTERFRPNGDKRKAMREALGLAVGVTVFGLVGRYDPHKDHAGFVEAIGQYASQGGEGTFVFCGGSADGRDRRIVDRIRALGLEDRILLLGVQDNIEDYYQVFDIVVSASVSEGFPNVVAEAMACGKPCIVTDVGDSRRLVDGAGIVVPPRSPGSMAAALAEMADMGTGEWDRLGRLGRQRIEQHYSLAAITRRYIDLYNSLAQPCAA